MHPVKDAGALVKVLLFLALAACSCAGPDMLIGQTRVYIHEGAVPWPDLPEALRSMQMATKEPYREEAYDVDLHLYAPWRTLTDSPGIPWGEGTFIACIYEHKTDTIRARTSTVGLTLEDSCLPHEFAHRLMRIIQGQDTDENRNHGPLFWLIEGELRERSIEIRDL